MMALMKHIASERDARQMADTEIQIERKEKAALKEGVQARELLLESSMATIQLHKERVEELEVEVAMLRRDADWENLSSDWGKSLNAKLGKLDGAIATAESRLKVEAATSGWSDEKLKTKVAEATAHVRADAINSQMATASAWSEGLFETKLVAVRGRLKEEAAALGWSDHMLHGKIAEAEELIHEESIAAAANKAAEWSKNILNAKMVVIRDKLVKEGKERGWTDQYLREKIAQAELQVVQEGVAAEEAKAEGWGKKLFDAKMAVQEARLHDEAAAQNWSAQQLGTRIAEAENHIREEAAAAEAMNGWMSSLSQSTAASSFILEHGFPGPGGGGGLAGCALPRGPAG